MARLKKESPLQLMDAYDRYIWKQYKLFKSKRITGIKVPFEGDGEEVRK